MIDAYKELEDAINSCDGIDAWHCAVRVDILKAAQHALSDQDVFLFRLKEANRAFAAGTNCIALMGIICGTHDFRFHRDKAIAETKDSRPVFEYKTQRPEDLGFSRFKTRKLLIQGCTVKIGAARYEVCWVNFDTAHLVLSVPVEGFDITEVEIAAPEVIE